MALNAQPGRGASLNVSLDGVEFTKIGQLRKCVFAGLKTQLLETTNIRTPAPWTKKAAVRVDSGDVSYDGVLDPNDGGYNLLATLQQGLTLAFFELVLRDTTVYSFQGFVAEHVPADVGVSKLIGFSGKIAIVGGVAQSTGGSSGGSGGGGMASLIWTTFSSTAVIGASVQGCKCVGGSGGITLTTPAASANPNKVIWFYRQSGPGNTRIVDPNGALFGSASEYDLVNDGQFAAFGSDGTRWIPVSGS